MRRRFMAWTLALFTSCWTGSGWAATGGKMQLTATSFDHKGAIPRPFTCEGADIGPGLRWHGLPAGTQSLVLIVDDPDAPDPKAPKTTWVHEVVVNLPPNGDGLGEGHVLPRGARFGLNDWQKPAWGGPCPPVGRHRYFFKLYALDVTLPQPESPTKAQVLAMMKGHVLAEAQIIGTYQKAGTASR